MDAKIAKVESLTAVFVCPNCGETHTPEQFPALPVECQIQLFTMSESDKFITQPPEA